MIILSRDRIKSVRTAFTEHPPGALHSRLEIRIQPLIAERPAKH
jgi:hypothetical protein